jgi:hypothetical protein
MIQIRNCNSLALNHLHRRSGFIFSTITVPNGTVTLIRLKQIITTLQMVRYRCYSNNHYWIKGQTRRLLKLQNENVEKICTTTNHAVAIYIY